MSNIRLPLFACVAVLIALVAVSPGALETDTPPAPAPVALVGTHPFPGGDGPVTQASSTRTYENTAGGWSVEVPTDWQVDADGKNAIFRSWTGAQTIDRPTTGTPAIPTSEVKITVTVFANTRSLSAAQIADEFLYAPGPSRKGTTLRARDDEFSIAGATATRLVLEVAAERGAKQTIGRYFFVSPSRDRFFWIDVNPETTARTSELGMFVRTLRVK